ncbi:MAG: hypothetical protein IKX79_00460, partial [Desulfovibrionaceae bacterium]|nr:hypothetical protein [Desulfovibrionaceae bacterium]
MAIDLQALDMFRSAQNWTEKGIAKLEGQEAIKQNGTYSGALSALTRSDTERAENNRVRTELLRALGNAFGLSGMSEEEGTVTFSKDFMDRLEKLLGSDFKRDDFKMDAQGNVSSGRPLTARRIKAIIAKAEKAAGKIDTGSASEAEGVSKTATSGKESLSRTGGLRKDETYKPYVDTLAEIKKD